MPLPVPNLDDRTFQELVNEARQRIPLFCPEWTDHNLSDPGITLVELFSWMTELLIYRLNKAPDKNYVKFLELMGVKMRPAHPASADITFRLSAALPHAVTIPAGTEVATVRTETQDAIIFTTEETLTVTPPELAYFLVTRDESRFDDRMPTLQEWARLEAIGESPTTGGGPESFTLFHSPPEPGNRFYLGYNTDLRDIVLSIYLDCEHAAAPGINPANPPLAWEYWDTYLESWTSFDRHPEAAAWLEADGTRGLNTAGSVILHLPHTAGRRLVDQKEAFWVRCRVTPSGDRQGSYDAPPRLRATATTAIGCTALSTNTTWIRGELLETSTGKPGQVMRVSNLPLLPLLPGETVEVQRDDETGWEAWQQVEDFSNSGPEDKHFVCDPAGGEIQFGPQMRSPRGATVRYGATPSLGSQVRMSAYRHGGGARGNVGRGTLTVLKSSIAYVASVTNRRAATGGVDPEDINGAKIRGPQILRTRDRAVTEEDFEHLAKEASLLVGRARCLQPRELGAPGTPPPGVVQLALAPAIPPSQKRISPDQLILPRELVEEVRNYLDDRRLLATALIIAEPDYVWVSSELRVSVRRGADLDKVKEALESQLYRHIHPLAGGPEGTGWPFGKDLFASELYSLIQETPGVQYVAELKIFPVDPATGLRGESAESISVPPGGLACSYIHNVTCFYQERF